MSLRRGPSWSDWDFGFLEERPGSLDAADLHARLTVATASDQVDLADLATASALLRSRGARDGVVLLERPAGTFGRFQPDAVRFWCDAGPVIRAAQSGVLASLG